jgi:hypothetical protein
MIQPTFDLLNPQILLAWNTVPNARPGIVQPQIALTQHGGAIVVEGHRVAITYDDVPEMDHICNLRREFVRQPPGTRQWAAGAGRPANPFSRHWLRTRLGRRRGAECSLRCGDQGCVMKRGSLARAWPTAASLLVLVAGFAAISPDAREYFARMSRGGASAEFASISWRAQDAGLFVAHTINDQRIAHGPLMFYSIAAGLLVIFMLRT